MKRLALFCVSVFFTLSAMGTVNVIAEKYFFDKFFYKKSYVFGYFKQVSELFSTTAASTLGKRAADVKPLLVDAYSHGDNYVLGVQKNLEDEYKIAVIGDSFAYGLGVRDGQRYPAVLEKLLNQTRPTRVYSMALPGDNILEHYAKFLLAKSQLKSNLYIIGIADNDLLINADEQYDGQSSVHARLKNVCKKDEFYSKPDASISIENLIVSAYRPSFNEQYANVCYLKEIVREMVKEPVIFFNFYRVTPVVDQKDNSLSVDITIMQKYTNIIRELGGKVYQLHDSPIKGEYRQVSLREGHPDAQTHEWFARALYREILSNKQYGFIN